MAESAAKRYAEALFELANDKDVVVPVSDGLLKVREALSSDAELARKFFDERVPASEKKSLAAERMTSGAHPFVVNVVKLLIDRRREGGLLHLILAFFEMRERAEGVLRITVESAHELADDEFMGLTQRLESATGKKVLLTAVVDEELIGGLRLLVGSTLIDGTIKRRFEDLGARLEQAI